MLLGEWLVNGMRDRLYIDRTNNEVPLYNCFIRIFFPLTTIFNIFDRTTGTIQELLHMYFYCCSTLYHLLFLTAQFIMEPTV